MLPVSAACVSSGVEGTTEPERSGPTDRVELGPGKFFRPTKGLCALFLRTGTKRKPRCTPKPPPSPSSSLRRSFVDVVREGKDMAGQGPGNGGNFGEHGGGRGAGFNPGFNPGYDPGFGGRGRGHSFLGRGGRGADRGFAPHRGRDRFGGYNNLGGRNSGAHYYGGGRNFGGVRGQGGRRGRGGRHNTDYPHPRHPVPPHQYGSSGAVGAYPNPAHDGLYQTVGGYQHPIGGFFPQPQPMEVNPQQVLMGGHVQQQGGAASSAISGHQAPGSVVPPPQLETGTGKGDASSTSHATAMVVDTANMKATANPRGTVPPISEPKGTSLDIPESSDKGSKKTKGKPFCYRCRTKGHTIHECTVVLCCEVCFGDHVTKLCPNIKKTNTNAIPCGYAVEGLGFYFIPVVENPKANVEGKAAVVRVLEGSFTIDQLAVELENYYQIRNISGKLRQRALMLLLSIFHLLTYWKQW